MRFGLIFVVFILLLGFGIKNIYNPDGNHSEHLPLFQECQQSISSISAPGVSLHVREWEVPSPK